MEWASCPPRMMMMGMAGPQIQISGERTREQEDKSDTWHRIERSTGKFCHRFRLPDNARLDDVRAAMEHGVLTVIVPKVLDRNKPRNIKSITVN
ncbi:class I heat shock protein-like [Elaeis guineensis]|uniref:class I heat shock protein-like n=1 Tax=Elaeis guineensis var. tenera TaxID=51953 RepID=UPI000579BED2